MDKRSLDRFTQRVSENVERLKDTVLNDEGKEEHDVDMFSDVDRDRDFQDDADLLSGAVMEQFSPDSVIQIGCGIGMHLKPFLDEGIDAVGVDENRVAHENAVVPTEHIKIQNLKSVYRPDEAYDVVLCVDMLEYTSRNHEDAIIKTVAAAGKTAVVSVPLPRYSSLSYDREEPKTYWVQKFEDNGLSYDPEATRHLQEQLDADDEAWVPEQVLVFRKTAGN